MPNTDLLRFVIYQELAGVWIGRGLEHDFVVQARSIGEAVRSMLRVVEAHSVFDIRHDHAPLSAFGPAPQTCWNAFSTGTPISLAQFGVTSPAGWAVSVAIAHHHPAPPRAPQRSQSAAR